LLSNIHLRTIGKNEEKNASNAVANTASVIALATEEGEQPQKKPRLLESEEDLSIDEEEYDDALQLLQDELGTKKKKKGIYNQLIKELMEKTKKKRHQWIREDRPLIIEVLDKFPLLAKSRLV